MLDDSSIRLLATLGAGLLLGTWMRRRSKERARQWEADPTAARERAIRIAKLSAGGVSYVGSILICALIVLFVEAVVTFVHSIT